MDDWVPEERLIRKEGKWTHDIQDFKKIWPFTSDRRISSSFGSSSSSSTPDCYEESTLFQNQQMFHGTKIMALSSSSGRASAFALSPPVKRSDLGDFNDILLELVGQVGQLDQPWDGSHIVAFASAGHALGALDVNARICAEVEAGRYQSAWKRGIHILARNKEPVWPGISLENQHSPPVKAKRDGSKLFPVKPTPPSMKFHEPDLLFGAVTVGADCYGDVWPERRIEHPNKQWWYVPTCEVPDVESDKLIYCLQYPGAVREVELLAKYGVVQSKKATLMTLLMNQHCLVPDRMSISVGDVIGANEYLLKFRASTTCGGSGGPVASFDEPLKLYGLHIPGNFDDRLTSSAESNFNIATSVNHPLWVLNYVKDVLPILSHVRSWPSDYMLGALMEYLNHHEKLIRDHHLWHIVEKFHSCQNG